MQHVDHATVQQQLIISVMSSCYKTLSMSIQPLFYNILLFSLKPNTRQTFDRIFYLQSCQVAVQSGGQVQ